jgi:hypothetical protein
VWLGERRCVRENERESNRYESILKKMNKKKTAAKIKRKRENK